MSEATIICVRPEQSRRPRWQGFAIPFLLLLSCSGDPSADALHRTADSLIAAGRPDSALLLLNVPDSAGPENYSLSTNHYSPSQRMRHELLRARAMNKAFVDLSAREDSLSPDSVMLQVADWYDRHGTPNERMEAHYLLGCTYRDMGEAPRAVDCYLDAAACADTTATDCDYYTLASIYAQMARLYHQQLLLSNEIEAHRKASYYDFIAKDTLYAILEQKMVAGVYILQNKKDSAEAVLLQTMDFYHATGLQQKELQTSTMLMSLYTEQPNRLSDLKRLIDLYDEKSDMFDEHHELPPNKRLFYCYKARYFEGINELDSAEAYYRKMDHSDMPLTSQNSMYKGLLNVFGKRGIADSIAKYAILYCSVNDSSINIKDKDLTAQLAASYRYNCIQKESNINAEKAHKAETRLFFASLMLLAIVSFIVILISKNRTQRKKQMERYIATIAERTKLRKELASLKAKDYDGVIARKEKEIANLNKTIAEHSAAYREVMLNDKLSVFERSTIVKIFSEKSNYRKGHQDITNDEWDELVEEFRQDMPSACSMMNSLSPLQLHVCILLLLGYDESVIAVLKNTMPQTINKAKVRANEKMFKMGDASSLMSNLKRALIV